MCKIARTIVLLSFVILIAGCASMKTQSGTDFDVSVVAKIQQNHTTKSDVLSYLGTPYSKSVNVINGVEKETWIYMYMNVQSQAKGFMFSYTGTAKVDHKSLVIVFNGEIVESYNMTVNPGNTSINTTAN